MAGSNGKRKRMWIHPFNYQLRLADSLGWASDAGRGWQDTHPPPPLSGGARGAGVSLVLTSKGEKSSRGGRAAGRGRVARKVLKEEEFTWQGNVNPAGPDLCTAHRPPCAWLCSTCSPQADPALRPTWQPVLLASPVNS